MTRFALILAAVALLAPAVPAFALPGFEVGARGTYWFPQLSGTVESTSPGFAETQIDVKNDLGIGDKNLPGGQAFVRLGSWHFRLGYTQVTFDGDKVVNRTFNFHGQSFTAGQRVISRLDTKMFDGEIQYDLLRPDVVAVAFNLGLILKVKYVDGSVDLADNTTTTSKDFRAPIPMVGAAVGVGVLKNMVRADAQVSGMAYSGNHLYDADGWVSLAPFPFLRIQGGYRYMDLKADDKPDILAAIKLKGPYAGLQLSF